MNELEDGFMEPLHEHNQKTYENICRMFAEGIQRVAVVQPTGSGKSLLVAKLIEDNPNSRFFVLSTSHKINDQFKEKLDEEMLERVECNIYCNMPNMKQEIMESLQPDYIFLDEMHRALAKEWSKGINVLLEMYPNAKVLGLSATPIRYLDKCRNVAEELFGGNLACDMSLSQAILDGILPMARYVCGVYSYEKDTESLNKKIERSTNSDEEKKELLKELKILKENLDKGHGVADIFKKYIVTGSEKFVVFLKDTTHLGIMKPIIEKWFIDAGFTARLYEVHSKNADKDREFQKFKEDTEDGVIKACLSVNMIAEGIHGDIDGVIMLRETMSPNMYFQMIGRAFACGKKTIPLIIDLVANSQFISDAANLSFPNELRGEIEKRKKECEKEGKDYEAGFDVNKFIVMDEFMDVVSGFREIEGRLIGSWDSWMDEEIEILKQNFEKIGAMKIVKRNLLPRHNYGTIKGKAYQLGLKYEKGIRYVPNEEDDKILIKNYSEYGKNVMELLPHMTENQIKHRAKQLDLKFDNKPWTGGEKKILRDSYNNFSIEEVMKKLPNRNKAAIISFACKMGITSERSVKWSREEDEILYSLYPEHGSKMFNQLPGKTKMQIQHRLNKLNIKKSDPYEAKMILVKEALREGIVISKENPCYKGVNLYEWRVYNRKKFTKKEMETINQVIPNRKLKIAIKMIDTTTEHIYIYPSKFSVIKALCNEFGVLQKEGSIRGAIERRLSGGVTTPYKGRFMFYYATDEEVKKYLEDNKVS